jgi:hypothetical protein
MARYRVIVAVALHDRPEPLARERRRLVAALAPLLMNDFQLGCHALACRFAPHREAARFSVPPAQVREAQKVERLRFLLSPPLPVRLGISPKLDQARLVRL